MPKGQPERLSLFANRLQDDGSLKEYPAGMILLWQGTIAPYGWRICDGTNGTPNIKPPQNGLIYIRKEPFPV